MRMLCAVFNFVMGMAGAFVGFMLTAMGIDFSGDAAHMSDVAILQTTFVATLILSGVLYARSGILLGKKDPVR